jgi:hypothetical protein
MTATAPAPSILSTVAKGLIGATISAAQADSANIIAWIGSGTTEAQAWITTLLSKIPKPSGVEGLIVGPIEAAAEAGITGFIAQEVSTYTPTVLFNLFIALLTHLQSEV